MPHQKTAWWKRAFIKIIKEPIKKYESYTLYQFYGIKFDR